MNCAVKEWFCSLSDAYRLTLMGVVEEAQHLKRGNGRSRAQAVERALLQLAAFLPGSPSCRVLPKSARDSHNA